MIKRRKAPDALKFEEIHNVENDLTKSFKKYLEINDQPLNLQKAQTLVSFGCGITNVGNTCYMNSCIQVIN